MRRRSLGLAAGLTATLGLTGLLVWVGPESAQGHALRLAGWIRDIPGALGVLLTLAALVLIAFLSQRIETALLQDTDDINARHKTRKVVAWGRMILSGLMVLLIWAQQVQGLGVFLGLLGAGLTLSVQEGLLCIAGWGLILMRRPFDIGDRIEVDGHIGDVIDIRIFYSTLIEVGKWCAGEMSTGRIVHIPNSYLFRKVALNYSQGFPFLWNEATFVFTFESDWEKGRDILAEWAEVEASKIESEVRRSLERGQEHFPIKYRQLRPTVFAAVADHGAALTLRYLCPVRRRRITEHELAVHVLKRVAETPGVEFAYPTTRFFRASEGSHAPADAAGQPAGAC